MDGVRSRSSYLWVNTMMDNMVRDWVSADTDQVKSAFHGTATRCQVGLVGGKRIIRRSIEGMLTGKGLGVAECLADADELERLLKEGQAKTCNVFVLILAGRSPFGTFRRIHDIMSASGKTVPLVVLSEQASRGQVYAALRIGAKAYVNFDAEPDELAKAIEKAASGKVYLSPDIAELLVNDISTASSEDSQSPRLPRVDLSKREVEVVQLLCEGLSSKEIARHLHISSKTVENHRYNIYRKCEVDSIASLMRYAIQQGMVSI